MTETETTEIVPQTTLRSLLESKTDQLATLVPRHMTADRIIKLALLAVNRNDKLMECSPASVLKCVIQAAELGLDFSGTMGQAYLVPFAGNCTLIPGYRGLADLARRHSGVEVEAECVFETDEFKWCRGTEPRIDHNPHGERSDDSTITHAYAIGRFPSGSVKFEVMTRAQIQKIRAISKQPNGMLWKDHYHEACRKTLVRRLCKYLPMSPELSRAVELGDQEFELQGMDRAIDVTPEDRTGDLAKRISGTATLVPEPTPDPEHDVIPPAETIPVGPEHIAEIDIAVKRTEKLEFVCSKTTGCSLEIAHEAVAVWMKRSKFTKKKIEDAEIYAKIILPKSDKVDWTEYTTVLQAGARSRLLHHP